MSSPIHLLVVAPSESRRLLEARCLAELGDPPGPEATDERGKATCIRCLMDLADEEDRDLSLAEQARATGSYPRFRAVRGWGGATWTVEDEDEQRTVLHGLDETKARRCAAILEREVGERRR